MLSTFINHINLYQILSTCHRRELDFQPVHVIAEFYLATEAAVVFDKKSRVEHGEFVVGGFGQRVIAEDVNVAGCAECHAAAGTFHREFVGFAQFHEAERHIRGGFKVVGEVFAVEDGDFDILHFQILSKI